MDPNIKKQLRIASYVMIFAIALGLAGTWLAPSYQLLRVSFIIIGLNAIIFSKPLALERAYKYQVNYRFARAGFALIAAFVIANTTWLAATFLG